MIKDTKGREWIPPDFTREVKGCKVCGGPVYADEDSHTWQDCIRSLKERMNDELERIDEAIKECEE